MTPILLTEFVILPRDVLWKTDARRHIFVHSRTVGYTFAETMLTFVLTFVVEGWDLVLHHGGWLARHRSRNLRYNSLTLGGAQIARCMGWSVVLGAHLVFCIITQRHRNHPILIPLVYLSPWILPLTWIFSWMTSMSNRVMQIRFRVILETSNWVSII